MIRSISTMFLRSCAVFLAAAMIAPAYGSSSVPSYTVTDLGPYAQGFTLSSTGANGTLTTSDGTIYAFPRTDNLVANPQSLLSTFPPFTNAPDYSTTANRNQSDGYSNFSGFHVYLNQMGEFVATDLVGVSGHIAAASSTVVAATRQADGSFSPLHWLWNAPNNNYSGGQVAQALDLNNSGLILGVDGGDNRYAGSRDFFLYDLHSGIRTELTSLLQPASWYSAIPLAIDDQGRILVEAVQGPYTQLGPFHLESVLLTPDGLSSSPIPAPEPTTLVTLAVAGVGLAIRRWWKP